MENRKIDDVDVAVLIHSASKSERISMQNVLGKAGLDTKGIAANEMIHEAIFNSDVIDMNKLKMGLDSAAKEIVYLKKKIDNSLSLGNSANLGKTEITQISY